MVYYMDCTDNLLTSRDLELAFFVATGKTAQFDKRGFWKFREKCFGKSIKKTIPADVDDFVRHGWKFEAIKLYRELNDCTLREAKEAIDAKFEEAKSNP